MPKVTLIAHTERPIETIYLIWELSKTNKPLNGPGGIGYAAFDDHGKASKEAREIFEKVVDAKIPVAENLNFVFLLEDVSISFREQMVRHRIGVNVGERLGADIVPDLADSTWWSQSMRILPMDRFATDGHFRLPENMTREQQEEYVLAMMRAENAYNRLVASGMSLEDAREVIPLAAQHRITWGLNLAALQHIIGKRGCQILQGDLWAPVIKGMVDELAKKVDPYFRRLIAPPCIKGGKYSACQFKIDNERRQNGDDEIPPCTLWVGKERPQDVKHWSTVERFNKMARQYGELWDRDPFSFEVLKDEAHKTAARN